MFCNFFQWQKIQPNNSWFAAYRQRNPKQSKKNRFCPKINDCLVKKLFTRDLDVIYWICLWSIRRATMCTHSANYLIGVNALHAFFYHSKLWGHTIKINYQFIAYMWNVFWVELGKIFFFVFCVEKPQFLSCNSYVSNLSFKFLLVFAINKSNQFKKRDNIWASTGKIICLTFSSIDKWQPSNFFIC